MKYYIIAGEASGDMHAANLMKELKKLDSEAAFRCWGGDRMKEQDGDLVHHYRETAFMGFVEVFVHIRTIWKLIQFCRKDILRYRPDAVILVDYPGFNLRIASFAHKKGFRIIYYVSPQVWAWKSSRVEKIRTNVDRMYVILPFEKEFYHQHGYDVFYVGHPLLDALAQLREGPSLEFQSRLGLSKGPVIALLPGSRKQEIARILPVMLTVVPGLSGYQFVVAGLSVHGTEFYQSLVAGLPVEVLYDQTYSLLQHAHAALVTSGTATLETALLGVPQVICYKGGTLSYQIARRLVRVPFIGLVNLIMEKEIVKELIQEELTRDNLLRELSLIVENEATRAQIVKDYELLRQKLGGTGASARTAGSILSYLKESNNND